MSGVRLEAIRPKVRSSVFQAVIAETEAAMRRTTDDLLADFEATAAGWRNPPRWRVRVGREHITVTTDDEVWHFQDAGTRPHEIRARRAKVLAFTSRSGDRVFTPRVSHPGTAPRHFTRDIQGKWERMWPERLRAAVKRAGG